MDDNSVLFQLGKLAIVLYGLAFMGSWIFGGPGRLNRWLGRQLVAGIRAAFRFLGWLAAAALRLLWRVVRAFLLWIGQRIQMSAARWPRTMAVMLLLLLAGTAFAVILVWPRFFP